MGMRERGELCSDGSGEAERLAAWESYFAEHPEVLASWAHQNGYWPPQATLPGTEVWDAQAVR